MKKPLRLLLMLTVVLLASGCAGSVPEPASSPVPEEQSDNLLPPDNLLPVMIMVEDTLYQHDVGALDSSIKIEDSQLLGHITQDIGNEIPTQNGEACWVKEGTPYARCPLPEYPEGMVALIARQWWIFLPVAQ